jgi:hypothetical protein
MTDSSDISKDIEAAAEVPKEEEFDENDYAPGFVEQLLRNPDRLPRNFREDFVRIFESFEWSHHGRAKTAIEYMLVTEATKLVLTLTHLDRMEDTILLNQQRPAVESLFRRTHEGAAMQNVEAGIRSAAVISANEYFADPAFKLKADKSFEAAGYAPNALEGEAYLRAQSSLAIIHREKAVNRKALFNILKDLETRYSSRHPEKEMVVRKSQANSAKRVSKEDG